MDHVPPVRNGAVRDHEEGDILFPGEGEDIAVGSLPVHGEVEQGEVVLVIPFIGVQHLCPVGGGGGDVSWTQEFYHHIVVVVKYQSLVVRQSDGKPVRPSERISIIARTCAEPPCTANGKGVIVQVPDHGSESHNDRFIDIELEGTAMLIHGLPERVLCEDSPVVDPGYGSISFINNPGTFRDLDGSERTGIHVQIHHFLLIGVDEQGIFHVPGNLVPHIRVVVLPEQHGSCFVQVDPGVGKRFQKFYFRSMVELIIV